MFCCNKSKHKKKKTVRLLPFIVQLRKTNITSQQSCWTLVSSLVRASVSGSLTGQFAIEGGEGDGEGLQGAQREAVVHGEDVLCHTAKLHHDVVVCKGGVRGG